MGCGSIGSKQEVAYGTTKPGCPVPQGPIPESNKRMAALLAGMQAQLDSAPDAYQNSALADRIGAMMRTTPDRHHQAILMLQRTEQLLNAGRIQEAIASVAPMVQQMDAGVFMMPSEGKRNLLHLLAICHLRAGEQINCRENHNAASCIMPLTEEARHRDRSGSQQAKALYLRILGEFPDDVSARWLLNVASMTLGEHPTGVPAQWLIPESAFASTATMSRMPDVAMASGIVDNDLAGGACIEDFNNDGLLDIITSSWSLKENIRVYINNGRGGFAEQAAEAGLEGITGGLNMNHADFDNDGNMDVLVMRGAWLSTSFQPNSLLRNLGDGRFQDVTEASGMLHPHRSQNAAWGDFDNDGWLDLFIGNETSQGDQPLFCELYHNERNGTFREVAAAAGLDVVGFIKGSAWGDVDNNGWIDLYVSDLEGPNRLFMNAGPDGSGQVRFHEAPAAAGVALPAQGFPAFLFDYDNDGWLDIYAGAFPRRDFGGRYGEQVAAHYLGLPVQSEHPRLYRNKGNGTFRDATTEAGLDQPLFAMGSNFGDLNNDGWPDICLGTGEPDFRSIIPNRMLLNNGKGHFDDVTTAAGFGNLQKGHGIAFGDLDNDGDQDIYADLGGAYEGDGYPDQLLVNPGSGNHWITLRLQGTRSARCAIGARVAVTVRGPQGERTVHTCVGSGGSFGASSLLQEIGLGDATTIVRVTVRWPGSAEPQVLNGLAVDAAYTIVEGAIAAVPLRMAPVTLPAPNAAPSGHLHAQH